MDATTLRQRTSREEYYLDLAFRSSAQGTCLRRNYGVTIVDDYHTIVATGYTGAPRGQAHCGEIGYCYRQMHNIPPGHDYTRCRSVHAEQNAINYAGRDARGCTLYLAGCDATTGAIVVQYPCFQCAKSILNAGIKMIVIRDQPPNPPIRITPEALYAQRVREYLGE